MITSLGFHYMNTLEQLIFLISVFLELWHNCRFLWISKIYYSDFTKVLSMCPTCYWETIIFHYIFPMCYTYKNAFSFCIFILNLSLTNSGSSAHFGLGDFWYHFKFCPSAQVRCGAGLKITEQAIIMDTYGYLIILPVKKWRELQ